ncbi:substrate-binding domain-containing protein [bacterium]|jgi:LacI family transcriptional regulator|nr:substrate-binding domain-containing protein [bacterium]
MKISIKTKCDQVKTFILNLIKDYPPNSRIMSEPELSQQLGVSRVTVAKALSELVAEGIVYREQGRGTFTASPSSIPKTNQIGCLVSSYPYPIMGNPFYSKIYNAIEEEAREVGLDVILQSVHERSGVDFIMPSLIDRKQIDGILLVGEISKDIVRKIDNLKLKCVIIDNYYDDIALKYVKTENIEGAKSAVDYLLKLGHRKIAFIGGPLERNSFSDRYVGYKNALKQAGVKRQKDFEIIGDVNCGYNEALIVTKLKEKPTAIFAANDAIALNVIKALKDENFAVPHDISVIGFDDIEPSSETDPALTTLAVDKEKMGKISVDILKNLINDDRDIESCELGVRLIERKSCKEV